MARKPKVSTGCCLASFETIWEQKEHAKVCPNRGGVSEEATSLHAVQRGDRVVADVGQSPEPQAPYGMSDRHPY